MTTDFAASTSLINFQCMQFSVILGVYKDCLSVEITETRHIVGRRASVCATRFFHRRRIKFAFFGCGIFQVWKATET